MSMLDFALGLAGCPQATIDDLDKALPGMGRLAAYAKQAEPLLNAAKPHFDALAPIMIKLWPILQRAYPDIVAVTPSVDALITFINSKEEHQ